MPELWTIDDMNPKLRKISLSVVWVVGWYIVSSLVFSYLAPTVFGIRMTTRDAFGLFLVPSGLAIIVLVLCILGWLPGTRGK